jgi:2-polyprenyl-3-methyl-5-hydroxy-6-metoxy-1,4-benzoquinol methylase
MEKVSCNLCGSNSFRTIYRLSDWLLDRPTVESTIVQCQSCGLIYQNPRPSIDEMDQHYPQDYEPYNSDKKSPSWLQRKAVNYGFEKRAKNVIAYKAKGSLLDIGCATGTFLNHMRQKHNWQVCGVEISSYAAQAAKEMYGLDVFNGMLEQANFPDGSFDAVTMWDVLEHLHDPSNTLREIHRILKPGGILVFRVPNGDSLDARLFGPYWAGFDAPRHLYVYQRSTLHKLLEKNGFMFRSATSRQASYMGFVVSLRFWMTGKKVNPSTREALAKFFYLPVTRLAAAPLFFVYDLFDRSTQLTVTALAKK